MEFKKYPSIARLTKKMVITEKIDGTNACIVIGEDGEFMCQSRNRIIEPGDDNAGFAKRAYENKEELIEKLGPGYHYGEWFGAGIQRRYGMQEKHFALFVNRYEELPTCCTVTPVLYEGDFSSDMIDEVMAKLGHEGSVIAPGFMNPEGIVVYHCASGSLYKKTFENDGGKYTVE